MLTHDDWITFLRAMNAVGMTASVVLLPTYHWMVIGLFITTSFALACMVADGLIGEWRERHDMAEWRREVEDAERMGRQLRRMRDLYEWEARKR